MALLYNIEPYVLITSVGLLKNDRFAQFNSKPSVKQGQDITDEKKSVVNGFKILAQSLIHLIGTFWPQSSRVKVTQCSMSHVTR